MAHADNPTPVLTYRVVIVCPEPRHEFTMTVDARDLEGDPAGQACEAVFALLNIGRNAIDDLPHLGCSPQQVDAVRTWYASHHDLNSGVRLEVITPHGTVRHLTCDDLGYAHPADGLPDEGSRPGPGR